MKLYVCWGTFPTPATRRASLRERLPRAARRRLRPGGRQVLRVRAAAGGPQPDAGAPGGPGADRQPLGADARARRRHRDRRLAGDRRLGARQPGERRLARTASRRSHTLPGPRVTDLQANSTAATEVARFRLETPVAHRDADQRASARAVSSSLSPWRSVPKASTARGGSAARVAAARRRGRARAAAARPRRAPRGSPGAPTGSAKCSPAAPRSASGCQGSWLPVVSTPAASAAAATRTHAPMLPRSRGSSSRITGRGCGLGEHRARRRPRGARRAPSRRCVGASGASCSNIARSTARASSASARAEVGREPRREPLAARPGRCVTSSSSTGAEAQRVLDGVEAFEHRQRRVAPRAAEARDERSVLHAAIIRSPSPRTSSWPR